MDVTQADRQIVAACIVQGVSHPPIQHILNSGKDEWFFVQAFAAHRKAALLEGVRIGLAAAADDAVTWFPEATTGKYRAGGVVGSIRSLDPATVLARHGGA